MKLDALDHPKTLDLSARLNVSLPTVIGHLELLWAFTSKKASQGNIGKWPDGAIARACYWEGDPSLFVNAIIEAGFADTHPEQRVIIHDWKDHAPRWIMSKLSRAKLEIFDSSTEYSGECTSDSTTDCSDDTVSQAKPSLVKPSLVNNTCGEPDGSPPFITLTANSGDEIPITNSQREEWGTLFPAVDVPQELRNMRAWLMANPRNRKTPSGMLRFATSWLSRAQNSSRTAAQQPQKPQRAFPQQ